MALDLRLGLGEKTQAPAIACEPEASPHANDPAYHNGSAGSAR
jgi:hypothetical protein